MHFPDFLGSELSELIAVRHGLGNGHILPLAKRRCRSYTEAGSPLVLGRTFEYHVAVGYFYASWA